VAIAAFAGLHYQLKYIETAMTETVSPGRTTDQGRAPETGRAARSSGERIHSISRDPKGASALGR